MFCLPGVLAANCNQLLRLIQEIASVLLRNQKTPKHSSTSSLMRALSIFVANLHQNAFSA